MTHTSLNRDITITLLHLSDRFSNRHYTRFYYLINRHPKLNRNHRRKYPEALFEEGTQEAWADLNQKQIQAFLARLQSQGVKISPENSERIVTELITLLNTMIRNKTISLWRKETFPAA